MVSQYNHSRPYRPLHDKRHSRGSASTGSPSICEQYDLAKTRDRFAKRFDHLAKMNCLDAVVDREYAIGKIPEEVAMVPG